MSNSELPSVSEEHKAKALENLVKAVKLKNNEKWEAAIDKLFLARRLDRTNVEVQKEIARFFFESVQRQSQRSDKTQAIETFGYLKEENSKLKPMLFKKHDLMALEASIYRSDGWASITGDVRKKAIECLGSIPTNLTEPWMMEQLARMQLETGRSVYRAKDSIRYILARSPNDIELRSRIIDYYIKKSEEVRSRAAFIEDVIEITPDYEDWMLRNLHILQQKCEVEEEQDPVRFRIKMELALDSVPDNVDFRLDMFNICIRKAERSTGVDKLSYLNCAIEIDSRSIMALSERAYLNLYLENTEDAIRDFSKLIDLEYGERACTILGFLLISEGLFFQAYSHFEEARKRSAEPKFLILYGMGVALEGQQRFSEAEALLTEAFGIRPKSVPTVFGCLALPSSLIFEEIQSKWLAGFRPEKIWPVRKNRLSVLEYEHDPMGKKMS